MVLQSHSWVILWEHYLSTSYTTFHHLSMFSTFQGWACAICGPCHLAFLPSLPASWVLAHTLGLSFPDFSGYVCYIHSAYIHIFIYVYVLCKPKNIIILEIRKTSLKLEKQVVAMTIWYSLPQRQTKNGIWEPLNHKYSMITLVSVIDWFMPVTPGQFTGFNPNLQYLRLWLHWR